MTAFDASTTSLFLILRRASIALRRVSDTTGVFATDKAETRRRKWMPAIPFPGIHSKVRLSRDDASGGAAAAD
jgi:hypothetical protein